ncbi:hypothetical protein Tco_1437859 [Tanacetum coccineum]
MSSPNHSTSDIEDAFSSMNILNYTSVSSDYFPTSSESSSFNSSEDSRDGMIPPTFSLFYNNPYLKDVQAFYAKESPISPQDSITPPAILTPSPVLPPSLLFDPRYFFVPEELLPPKKQIHSSSTTLSNSSRNQTERIDTIVSAPPRSLLPLVLRQGSMDQEHHMRVIHDSNYILLSIIELIESIVTGADIESTSSTFDILKVSSGYSILMNSTSVVMILANGIESLLNSIPSILFAKKIGKVEWGVCSNAKEHISKTDGQFFFALISTNISVSKTSA